MIPYHSPLLSFTVHEEGGAYGGKSLAGYTKISAFISADGSPLPPESPLELAVSLAIWNKDALFLYDKTIKKWLLRQLKKYVSVSKRLFTITLPATQASLIKKVSLDTSPV